MCLRGAGTRVSKNFQRPLTPLAPGSSTAAVECGRESPNWSLNIHLITIPMGSPRHSVASTAAAAIGRGRESPRRSPNIHLITITHGRGRGSPSGSLNVHLITITQLCHSQHNKNMRSNGSII